MSESETKQEEEVIQCDYVFEPDDSSRGVIRTALTNKWHCPHPAVEQTAGKHLCLFHLPIEQKTSQEVQKRFLECMSMEGPAPKQFIGAEMPSLSLVNYIITSRDNNPIDLRNTTFHGDVSIDGSSINQAIYLTDAVFEGDISGIDVKLYGLFYAQNAKFAGKSIFRKTVFYNTVNFRNSEFGNHTEFAGCTFQSEANFYGCEFDIDPEPPTGKLTEVIHRRPMISFSNSTFIEGINLNSAIFHDMVFFANVTSEDTVHLENVELNGKYYIHEYTRPEWDHIPEEEKVGHHIAEFSGSFSGMRLSFESVPENPSIVSLIGANIEAGRFSHPMDRFVYFDFTQATLGNVMLNEMTSKEAWMHLIFNQTDFSGVNFTDYHPALVECGFDICAVQETESYDIFKELELQERETTFLKARIGADKVRDYRTSSEFKIQELDARRARLKQERDVIPYLAHLIYGITSRYGERPGRVLVTFVPVLLVSYWFTNIQAMTGAVSIFLGLLLALLPPIFSALLVLSSSRYIGN